MADVSGMRHPYHGVDFTLTTDDLTSFNPIKQFEAWFENVRSCKSILEPNAMALATATRAGVPSVRMLLCKGFSEEGFTFYTNYESRKGNELQENPNCSLMFYWEPLKRSVRIEGRAEKISEDLSKAYFNSRPRESRIGAIVSNQSRVILPSRQTLDNKNEELHEKYKDETVPIPKPDYWGGFLVRPYVYEFWQGQTNRLHDRLRFRKLQDGEQFDDRMMLKGDGDWIIERLSS